MTGRIQSGMRQAAFLSLVEKGVASVGRGSNVCPTIHVYHDPAGNIHGGRVHIGSFCSFGPDVQIFTGGNHHTEWVSTYHFRVELGLTGAWCDGAPTSKGDVTIGSDVWIGRGATVLSGLIIGNGAVIGTNAVVSRDVRPYAIVAGNPAREMRRRFSDEQVEALERIAWWDWPWDRILEHVPSLCSENVGAFVALWEKK